jgi:DNA-binding MarR family transcriptional regulator
MSGKRTAAEAAAKTPAARAVLAIMRTAVWLLEELEPVFAAHQTTAARFDVLETLSAFGQPVRPVEIRDKLRVPAQTITGTLDSLQQEGLIRRIPHPSDRRSILVELTTSGAASVAKLCQPLIAVEERLMSGVSPARIDALLQTLDAVQATIQEHRKRLATAEKSDSRRGRAVPRSA